MVESQYEFGPEADSVFRGFSYRIVGVSAVVLLGVGTSILQFMKALDGDAIFIAFLWFLLIFAHVAMAIFFFKPFDNFLQITNTEGDDITQLMTALSEMNFAFLMFLIFDTIFILVNILTEVA